MYEAVNIIVNETMLADDIGGCEDELGVGEQEKGGKGRDYGVTESWEDPRTLGGAVPSTTPLAEAPLQFEVDNDHQYHYQWEKTHCVVQHQDIEDVEISAETKRLYKLLEKLEVEDPVGEVVGEDEISGLRGGEPNGDLSVCRHVKGAGDDLTEEDEGIGWSSGEFDVEDYDD